MPRLLLYNMAYGQGCTGKKLEYFAFWRRLFSSNKKIEQIGSSINSTKADIVGLVEVDGHRKSKKQKNSQFLTLQQQLKTEFGHVSCKYASRGITSLARFIPILRKQSNGLLSQYKIVEHQNYYFSCGVKRLVSKYVLRIADKTCTIFLVHLALGKGTRTKQLQELSVLTRVVKGPMIVMGDFNATSQELAPLIMNGQKLKDACACTSQSQTVTFPSYKPKKQLDYILTSPQISINSMTTYPWLLSDHLPLCVDFDIL